MKKIQTSSRHAISLPVIIIFAIVFMVSTLLIKSAISQGGGIRRQPQKDVFTVVESSLCDAAQTFGVECGIPLPPRPVILTREDGSRFILNEPVIIVEEKEKPNNNTEPEKEE